jgi:uncharacterized membrane protein YccC
MRDPSSTGKRKTLLAATRNLLGSDGKASYRYDWSQGIRAAVGISIPIGIALLAGHLSWGILVGLATFWTLSCDVGGAYRQKAIALSGSGLAILGAYAFGVCITTSVPLYVIGTFVWSLVAALVGVAGNAAAQGGLVTTTIVVVAVVLAAPNEFWIRLFLCAIGILWALGLTLAFWPLHAFSPLFEAIEKSCDRLADLLDAVWTGAPTALKSASNLQVALTYDAMLSSLEQSRAVWGAVRARRAGPSSRSIQLLDLIERLDGVGRAVVAFRGVLNLVGSDEWFTAVRDELETLTKTLARLARQISNVLARHSGVIDIEDLESASRNLLPQLRKLGGTRPEQTHQELIRTVESLLKEFRRLAQTANELETGVSKKTSPEKPTTDLVLRRFSLTTEIRNNLSFHSNTFRHAVRLGVTTALAAIISAAFHITRGYWIPITVVVVMKPNYGGTIQRAAQRITGTVAGALLAALILWSIHEPWVLLLSLAILSFATFTLRWRNYGLFSLALTPMIMVMLDLARPGTPFDSFLRLIHTIIGSVLALVCGYVLFPLWERRRLPGQLAIAFRENALLVKALFSADDSNLSISELRKRSGLSIANAANAGQRLLTEPEHKRGDVESSLAAINFCRDIFYVLSALAHSPKERLEKIRSAGWQGLATKLVEALDNLANSLEKNVGPKPLPGEVINWSEWSRQSGVPEGIANGAVPAQDENGWIGLYIAALVDHVRLAHEAVSRLTAANQRTEERQKSLVAMLR